MRIGIFTQPLHNNYGGLLQNFALQQVLNNMGYEVETVDWCSAPSNSLKEWLWIKKEQLLCYFFKNRQQPRYKLTVQEEKRISKYTDGFINKYISVCPKKVVQRKDFIYIDKEFHYEAYIVGSDQVWRPNYNPFQTAMFLDFVKRDNVKRIAYAASFGTSIWEFTPQMTEECSRLAKLFNLLTVREGSGVKLCREHLGVEATHVLDPTMLLNREDYEKVVLAENEPKSGGTLFHYILDPSDEKQNLINQLAATRNFKPFTIMPKCQAENRTKWDVKHRIEDCVFPTVTSWLRGFMDAEMIVVDSFHGAVFSIIFNKPFWVIGNRKRGNARFESLLGIFGLDDRMIEPGQEIDWNKEIDWERVNDIREREKGRSVNLLKDALKKIEQ